MNSCLKFKEAINPKYKKVSWTEQEEILNCRPESIPKKEGPFSIANHVKLRRSIFGIFLENFNLQQDQDEFWNSDKLSLFNFDFQQLTPSEVKHFEDNNDFIEEGLVNLLVKAVREEDVVRGIFLYENVYAVKFVNLPLTVLDGDLRKYKKLKKLVLSGNLIHDVYGCDFPRDLRYLELFANDVHAMRNFVIEAPQKLIYLGLQRNKLHDGSRLHLLGQSGRFGCVQCLDLAENDIWELERTLKGLKQLPSLRYLQLQGNPCSVLCDYKDAVLNQLPLLVYLDNTEILPEDRKLFQFAVDVDAAITFDCHWIIGLPSPPKLKDVIQEFYLEVSMPLLEETIDVFNSTEEEEEKEIIKEQYKIIEKPKAAKGKKKEPSLYDSPNEYSPSDAKKATSFKTDRFPWAKVIQLPEEALVIRSPDGNLADIRDTFRTGVNVKLIYLQIEKPGKKGKDSKKGKDKKGDKGSKSKKDKSNKSKKEDETIEETNEPPMPVDEGPPPEVILKKITIANFRCDLHSLNWSDKTIDYFWPKSETINNQAIEVQGSLRSINYGGLNNKNDPTQESENKQPPVPLPKFFTIQIGFGLKRSYYQDFESPF